MCNIQLYVGCHKPYAVPKHPLLQPIQIGAAIADSHYEGYLHDDTGDNISDKNRSYCELTAFYWAWKNSVADYAGFFHYRRYLYPDCHAKRPYIIETIPTSEVLKRLDYDRFKQIITSYDLIVPMGENMFVSVRQHYADAPFHHEKDLQCVEDIIRENYPDYVPAMERYLAGTVHYFGNICIMRRNVFEDYCQWLFSILEEFDRRTGPNCYAGAEQRVNGYLAERLLGVYYNCHCGQWKTLELPRVYFDAIEDSSNLKRRFLYKLLPPGTKRRALMKRIKTM